MLGQILQSSVTKDETYNLNLVLGFFVIMTISILVVIMTISTVKDLELAYKREKGFGRSQIFHGFSIQKYSNCHGPFVTTIYQFQKNKGKQRMKQKSRVTS